MADDLSKLLASVDVPSADWVGLREVRETTTSHSARDAKPERTARSESHGVMVEVLAHGCFGYAATSSVDVEGVRRAAKLALRQAEASSPHALHRFTSIVRPRAVGSWQSAGRGEAEWPAGRVHALLGRICEKLRSSDEVVRTTAGVRHVVTTTRLVSSSGSDFTQSTEILGTDFSVTTARGAVVQRRSDGGPLAHIGQAGWDVLSEDDLFARVDAVTREAHALLDAPECPTENATLVLAPDQMILQIHESIGHPLEVDRILGDERNYAGTSFVRMEDFGTLQYGSDLMNVTWDPTLRGELASYGVDDVGHAATREALIARGVLLRGLGGVESQARSAKSGVATQRACSWNRPAIDRMANLNLEPGVTPLAELIGSVERGVLMKSNRSWSIDDRRDKFQFGCEWGQRIVDGELREVVRNPNYRGRTLSFWRGLSRVGDASTFEVYGTPYCGKGEPNQVIRVGHASPMCRFDGVEIFGGAS